MIKKKHLRGQRSSFDDDQCTPVSGKSFDSLPSFDHPPLIFAESQLLAVNLPQGFLVAIHAYPSSHIQLSVV